MAIPAKHVLKILVTGDVGAGKSEFIRTISEIDVVDTDKSVTDEARELKEKTTVALDFGRITVDDDVTLYLFGTPGQIRFDFMWEILSAGMVAFVVMFDATRPQTCWHTRRVLDFFEAAADVPYVVVANKQDCPGALTPAQVGYILALDGDSNSEVIPCNATSRADVKNVLLTLFDRIIQPDARG